jgi:hypothetical protein
MEIERRPHLSATHAVGQEGGLFWAHWSQPCPTRPGRGVAFQEDVLDQFAVGRQKGVLFLRWEPGVRITHAMAVAAAASLRELSDGEILPLVVVMGGIDGLTLKTRMEMNAYQGFSLVALVGDGPVDEVLAGFAHGSRTPTRYFTDETDALSWVQEDTSSSNESAA